MKLWSDFHWGLFLLFDLKPVANSKTRVNFSIQKKLSTKMASRTIAVSTACLTHLFYLSAIFECLSSQQLEKDIYRKPGNFPLSNSENKTSFTDEEKKLIVDLHNAYRSMVIPEATNMRELVWDNDLEEFARNHTQSCTGAHSNQKMVKKWQPEKEYWETWSWMGEVLYYRHLTWYSIREAMWMWWAEGRYYNITKDCVHGKVCGHYQVMTTDSNSRVACSINVCKKFNVSRYPTPATFMACSYNAQYYSDTRPYHVGKSCIHCTHHIQGYHYQYCRHNLCIGPKLRFQNIGFSGDTNVTGI
ncbi:hypothetical protein Btru_066763 [Bulinus truncatus]|nr:hypothetical protein Btru_066763 [Bulinus truncatus]